ncbi:signal transduction histidine kinase [Mucilaginibacter frigoritolerans]|uniref:histidine kinase n=1 Tax=Mucilaginibacter frigoritolerans TaxID=652788 RepID=A0A562UFS0_9SPHI|nr:HAMP domain-containing sensor histidine kinase [Mucilaginibacter frigoritolerans]TWJ04593.1 signal transduction histidine kinase [Mucilaginibacter frigoritolerans]
MRAPSIRLWIQIALLVIPLFVLTVAGAQQLELKKFEQQLAVTKDSLKVMRLMNKIGFLIHMKSADSSYIYGTKANAIAQQLHNTRGQADALTNIAISFALKGLYSQSLDYYSRAYHTYAKLPDTAEMAQMLMNSSISYSFINDSIKTKEFSQKAMFTARHLKADSTLCMLYANYVEMNNLTGNSAAYYLNKATELAIRFHYDRALVFVMQEKAGLFLDKKDNKAALPLILKSIQIARSNQWDYHQMEGLNVYATYYLAEKQTDSALYCYQQIYDMAAVNNFVYWKIDVLKDMLHIYELKHNLIKQAETNKLLVSALGKQNDNNSSFLGDYIKYNDAQENIKRLQLLDNANHKKQLWFIIASSVGSVTLLLLIGFYYRSRKHATVLKGLNEQITRQNKALKINDEFKGRLLSMLAHDFRAPLGEALGMVNLLRDEELDRTILLQSCNNIQTDIENVLLTFDNILQWIKKQLSGYIFTAEQLNLRELIEQSFSLFQHKIDDKQLVINNPIAPEFTLKSDREIVQFINRNLINNAIKFSPQCGAITCNVTSTESEIVISIKNEGKGMTETELNHLFSFKQSETTSRDAGMALTICKEFITLLNGRIWAESKPEFGATFYYSIPVK